MSARVETVLERRYAATPLAVDLSVDRKIRGTAIVFNAPSVDLGGFTEIITPAAVDRTIREVLDVRALVDHDTGKVLGRTRAGTLQFRKTRRGLEVEIDPPNTTAARDVLESIGRGDISGMSFAFSVPAGGDRWAVEDGAPVRTVDDMTISEVSIVAFPAYPQTDVAFRSLRAFEAEHVEMCARLDFYARVLRQARAS